MTLQVNRAEYPAVRFSFDIDGKVHAFDSMGDPWCENEDVEDDGGSPDGPPGDWDWCDGCLEACREEGALIEA